MDIKLYSEKLEKLKVNWDLSLKPKKEKGIYSELHQIAREASLYFNEPKKMMMYYGYCRKIGIQEARKRLAEQKESNIKEPKYFFKRYQ